jgi:hypothetical protein
MREREEEMTKKEATGKSKTTPPKAQLKTHVRINKVYAYHRLTNGQM